MAISRSDYSAEGWGRVLQDRWDRLQQLVDSGQLERHPLAESWNEHSKLLRDARRANDGGADPGDQPSVGDPNAQDDDPPANAVTHGATGGPRKGASISEDSAQRLRELGVSDRRIREILHPHSATAADNEAAAAMIPSLGRL